MKSLVQVWTCSCRERESEAGGSWRRRSLPAWPLSRGEQKPQLGCVPSPPCQLSLDTQRLTHPELRVPGGGKEPEGGQGVVCFHPSFLHRNLE